MDEQIPSENNPLPTQPDTSAGNTIPIPGDSPSVNKTRSIPLPIKILLFLLIGLIAFAIFAYFTRNTTPEGTLDTEFKTSTEPVKVTENLREDWINYKNTKYKFTFDYPGEGKVDVQDEESDDVKVYRTVITGERQTEPVTEDTTLVDGYMFKVSVTPGVIKPNLAELTNRKILNLKQTCPAIHSTSAVTNTVIDTIAAKTFTVTNCEVDYLINFVDYSGSVYEIALIYKGDFGYKQSYIQNARDILDSFHFLDKPIVVDEGSEYKVYQLDDRILDFEFEYPSRLSECCIVPGPVYEIHETLVTFADEAAYKDTDGKRFDGVGVFQFRNQGQQTFTDYINMQKKTLQDDYRIIKGYGNPNAKEEKVMFGKVQGVLLSGYAWWGDMAYFQISGNNDIIALSMVEASTGSFKEEFDRMLGSFRFDISGY
ncbi:hypothetical protein A2976_02455 [candidate division WWE3 bacterium RIFCSPLOWO2_01_FULL_41_9]|uniref:Uncharacterized protein n=1 Tax=candidate division WWE3 bacterium RIFCSPLOWO2_01_FULL_41_9 TaxID=1802626 RepID=A0A1F4VLN2_UNCKA|nr:MAG: hypothetical protein A2976_02455 [candidate division WWE3 bacterium RIFCSPLOWO2_01_FULL_41_9]